MFYENKKYTSHKIFCAFRKIWQISQKKCGIMLAISKDKIHKDTKDVSIYIEKEVLKMDFTITELNFIKHTVMYRI